MKEQIIEKFNLGKTLTYDELSYFFNGYLSNDIIQSRGMGKHLKERN